MEKLFITFLFLALVPPVPAQQFVPAAGLSQIKFTIKNFGLNVNGNFSRLKGRVVFDPLAITDASFILSMDAASVNTGNGSRDGHLRRKDYLDVAKYPEMSFRSVSIFTTKTANLHYVDGIISIKNVSRKVSFPFTSKAIDGGYLFVGNFALNRRDFNVGGKSLVLSDSVAVSFSVFTIKH